MNSCLVTHVHLLLSSFPNIRFLLIIWEFHMMHPMTPTSQSSQVCSTLVTTPPSKKEEETHRFNLCCSYTHWAMVKLLVASPLEKTESFPTWHPFRSHRLWRATLQCPYQFLRALFEASYLGCYFLSRGQVGIFTEVFPVSLSQL